MPSNGDVLRHYFYLKEVKRCSSEDAITNSFDDLLDVYQRNGAVTTDQFNIKRKIFANKWVDT